MARFARIVMPIYPHHVTPRGHRRQKTFFSWEWSSVHGHLRGSSDEHVTAEPMLNRIAHWSEYLQTANSGTELDTIRKHARTGRPIQDETFPTEPGEITGKELRILKPGPKADTQ